MQGGRKRGETQPIMTINITPESLRVCTESDLTGAAMSIYQLQHPLEKPLDSFARLLNCSKGLIVKCVDGKAHLGGERWIMIEETLGVTLYQQWLATKVKHNQ
jgi:hypothetical protein